MPRQQKHLLYIGHVWPEPDSSAAGYRTMAILEAALNAGWIVSFASAAQATPWSIDLSTRAINCHSIPINDSYFDTWIKEINPDYAIFDRFMTEEQFAWRVEKNCPSCVRIIDTIDLHFLRRARQTALNQNCPIDLFQEDSLREIAAIYRSDLSLIISDYEMQLLKDQFQLDPALLFYSPFMLERDKQQTLPDFSQRQHFIMIGNFIHPPNWDAVRWCYESIWPSIRSALPHAELHVYGAYTPDKAKTLNQPHKGFFVMGRAAALAQLFPSYRLNLVPLRYGAGIKGKVADGFIYGTPCISTSIGAEGMAGQLAWGGKICDSAKNFSDAAMQLYQDQQEWQKHQHNGWKIIDQIHPKQQRQEQLIQHLIYLGENIQAHRRRNFIGSMLRHHMHRSSEFMSRWIEEKNKKTDRNF